jgi:hypothetical protein
MRPARDSGGVPESAGRGAATDGPTNAGLRPSHRWPTESATDPAPSATGAVTLGDAASVRTGPRAHQRGSAHLRARARPPPPAGAGPIRGDSGASRTAASAYAIGRTRCKYGSARGRVGMLLTERITCRPGFGSSSSSSLCWPSLATLAGDACRDSRARSSSVPLVVSSDSPGSWRRQHSPDCPCVAEDPAPAWPSQ